MLPHRRFRSDYRGTAGKNRRCVNYLIDTIKRIFRWAVPQQLLHESVYPALLPDLRRTGRTATCSR